MNRQKYNQIQVAVVLFVFILIAIAIAGNNYLLSIIGVVVGMVFLALARSKAGIRPDEREVSIQEKAARMTYAIFAPTIGIGSFLLFIPSRSGWSVFSKGEFAYLESLGMVFAYLTLFLIAVYAISYHFLSKKYEGDGDEE
ncbi:MAG: DUF2178 domain-containing protein [Anaerolineae bacterium]|nr:DUF2178 domain-containing protein [Anaerolineae bacterium]